MGYLELFILSMIPIIELRAAIPIGISMGLNPIGIYISCVLGATLVGIPIILTCRYLLEYMKSKGMLLSVVKKVDEKIEHATNKIGNISFFGLLLFVAIPLPGSGTWSASMIASVMKLRLGKTMLSILLGNMIAGVIIMTIASPLRYLV